MVTRLLVIGLAAVALMLLAAVVAAYSRPCGYVAPPGRDRHECYYEPRGGDGTLVRACGCPRPAPGRPPARR